MLHVDIMDGHFVPNFTVGTPITEALRKRFPKLKLDHHLMIEDPDTYAPIFIDAGATSVSVHYEVCRNLDRTLACHSRAGRSGRALSSTRIPRSACLRMCSAFVDYVLVMSVNPGYGGQKFIPNTLKKISRSPPLA